MFSTIISLENLYYSIYLYSQQNIIYPGVHCIYPICLFLCLLYNLNHVLNLLNIEKLLSQDTDVLGYIINNLINFVVSIKVINIKLNIFKR